MHFSDGSSRHRTRTHGAAAVLALGLTLVLGGCKQTLDLSAVNDLAKTASASQAAFDDLAADYYDSCVRRTVYGTIGSAMEQSFPRTQAKTGLAPHRSLSPTFGMQPLSVAEIATLPTVDLVRRLTPAVASSLAESQYIVSGNPVR